MSTTNPAQPISTPTTASTTASTTAPEAPLTEIDRLTLDARLNELIALSAKRPKIFQPPPGMTDEVAIAAARTRYDMETQSMIREQISIIARLRRTSAGPAKKGGRRAKAAPLDLSAFMQQLTKL